MLPFQYILSQLGYALINSLWQMAVLLGIYMLLTSFFTFTAAARFRWASLLSIIGMIWFFATLFLQVQHPLFFDSSFVLNAQSNTQTIVGFVIYALSCTYIVWLTISMFLFGIKWRALENRQVMLNQKVPARLRLFVEEHASLLAIRPKVSIHISSHVSPATFGWIKPIILLPASCITQLSAKQMEALLLHELAHIHRYDYLVNCILSIAEKLLYFNPFMRKLVNEARAECEHACDDMVLQFKYPAVEYSSALLAIAKEHLQMNPALQATGNHSHLLYNRICRMLQIPVSPNKTTISLLTFILLPIIAILITHPVHPTKSLPAQKENGSLVYWKRTSGQEYQLQWQRTLFEARMDLLSTAIGRKEKVEPKINSVSIKRKIAVIDKNAVIIQKEKAASQKKELNIQGNREQTSLILSASWAQHQQETQENVEQSLSLGWKPMRVLLDKLELERKLNEVEWEKLAGLITVHTEIRMAIEKDANANKEGWVTKTINATETDSDPEILVIVYDETTGTLAASIVPRGQLGDDVQLDDNPTANVRQVILLRRKAEGKSKIISL